MSSKEYSSIGTDTCDDCGRHGPGTRYSVEQGTIYFICASCGSKQFEKTARRDIDSWLAGADFKG
jgi:predicted RNA-binding Zn-ribbon protein involved in translation (DUF1610 family)